MNDPMGVATTLHESLAILFPGVVITGFMCLVVMLLKNLQLDLESIPSFFGVAKIERDRNQETKQRGSM